MTVQLYKGYKAKALFTRVAERGDGIFFCHFPLENDTGQIYLFHLSAPVQTKLEHPREKHRRSLKQY